MTLTFDLDLKDQGLHSNKSFNLYVSYCIHLFNITLIKEHNSNNLLLDDLVKLHHGQNIMKSRRAMWCLTKSLFISLTCFSILEK